MMKEIKEKDFQLGMLDLSQNNIGVRGMAVLGSALAVGGNTSLRCLKLDFNAPHDEDMCDLGVCFDFPYFISSYVI